MRIGSSFRVGIPVSWGSLVTFAILTFLLAAIAITGPASAAQCSQTQAAEKAMQANGGQAISISVDGDTIYVRLLYPDGSTEWVGINRWSC